MLKKRYLAIAGLAVSGNSCIRLWQEEYNGTDTSPGNAY